MTSGGAEKKGIALIGSFPDLVGKATTLGLYVVNFVKLEEFDPAEACQADMTVICDWSNPTILIPIISALKESGRIHAVTSFWEWALDSAAYIADATGLPGVCQRTNYWTRNKIRMRERLKSCRSPNTVPFVPIREISDLNLAASSLGYPFVVKPAEGTASIDVQIVTDPTKLAAVKEVLIGCFSRWEAWLAESYVDGKEVSVDALSFKGHHTILAISEKDLSGSSNLVEMSHFQPDRLDSETRQRIVSAVELFLDDLECDHGPTHTELRIASDRVVIIESHARPGGDYIHHLVELTTGVDVVKETLRYLVEGSVPSLEPRVTGLVAHVKFFHFGCGRVASLDVAPALQALPGYVRHRLKIFPGTITGTLTDSRSRHGFILMTGNSHQEVQERLAQVSDAIRVAIEPVATQNAYT
jgi:predicted ATP-grasp superfamily ATP-dependent carboligase